MTPLMFALVWFEGRDEKLRFSCKQQVLEERGGDVIQRHSGVQGRQPPLPLLLGHTPDDLVKKNLYNISIFCEYNIHNFSPE